MADRFQKLYSLTPNMYTEGCPVLVEAGALQKDTESGAILAQIKMQNIGEKPIASCKISLNAYENNGNEIEGVSDFSYLDLNAEPGMSFGAKTPVIFPNETTRSYSIVIKEIVFTDKTVETYLPAEGKSVPPFKPLNSILNDAEIEKQYGIEVGGNCKYVPERQNGLFLCTCGGINNDTNTRCCNCGRSFETLTTALNAVDLEEKTNNRLAAEQAEREENAKKKEESKKKTRKTVKTICIAVAALLLVMGAYKGITAFLENRALANQYNEATAEFEQGNYLDAATKFEALGDYKDAQSKRILSFAMQMQKLVDEKKYDEASDYIAPLAMYCGNNTEEGKAVTKAYDSYHSVAESMLSNEEYGNARKLFSTINYKDSDKYVNYCDAVIAISQIEDKTNLTEIYQQVKALNDFNGADELIKGNKFLSAIDSWEGLWVNLDADRTDEVTVHNGELLFDFGPKVEQDIILLNGKICQRNWKVDKGDYTDSDPIIVDGNKMRFEDGTDRVYTRQ